MRNVVLDASSLVGALLKPGSVPDRALRTAADRDRLCLSPSVLAEVRGVSARPRFALYTFSGRAEAVLAILTRDALLVAPATTVTDCRDPKDNKYLELALAVGASVIVSSDQDLLVLHPWRGIAVLTPADYLAAPPLAPRPAPP